MEGVGNALKGLEGHNIFLVYHGMKWKVMLE
jgi:hypothetical protein